MKKGLFWLIPDYNGDYKMLSYSANCNENGIANENQPPYNSKKGNSYSHKNSWYIVTSTLPIKIRSKPWNYYPRGRVEIANNKATVYHNPIFSQWQDFINEIIREFELKEFTVRFISDYSKHYQHKEEKYL